MKELRFRQVHLDFHTSPLIPGIGAKFDRKQWQEALKKAHVDSITCFSSCHHGWSYHPTKVGKMHPGLDFNLLRAQMDACHEINVNVPIYLTGGVNNLAAEIHPEWREITAQGELGGWVSSPIRPGFRKLCFNTPYLDYLCCMIEEAVRLFPDADGVFIDIISQSPCCCNWCMADMAKEGYDPENPDDRARFAKRTLMKYYRRVTAAARSLNPEILRYVRNTLIISVMKIVLLFPLPVILAVMVSEIRNKHFSKLVQGLVFLPHFLSWVVIVGIFNNIFGLYGPVNNLAAALGGEPIYYMGEPGWFRWLVVILSGWKEIGYSSIVYIAAITAIDPALYEAAKMDGATKMQQIWHITIPAIMPTIMVMLIIRIGYLMEAGFEQVYAMLNSLTRETGEIIGTYVYRLGLGSGSRDYGLSTAVGLVNGVISLVLIISANRISKKRMGTGIW